jgi:hypothetical protein
MRVYRLELVVASANAVSPDELLNRLGACLATFEGGRSDDRAHRSVAAKATLVEVTSVDTVPDDARRWLLAAMRQVGKRRSSDLVEDRRLVG